MNHVLSLDVSLCNTGYSVFSNKLPGVSLPTVLLKLKQSIKNGTFISRMIRYVVFAR